MRNLWNWTYPDVTDFLRKHGFSFHRQIGGSHQYWRKPPNEETGTPEILVELNFTHRSYPISTLKLILLQSRIPKGVWIAWTRSQ